MGWVVLLAVVVVLVYVWLFADGAVCRDSLIVLFFMYLIFICVCFVIAGVFDCWLTVCMFCGLWFC